MSKPNIIIRCGDGEEYLDDAVFAEDLKIAIVTDPPYEFNSSGGGKFRRARKSSNIITEKKMDKGFNLDILTWSFISSVVCFMHNDQMERILNVLGHTFDRKTICGWIKTNPSPMANKSYVADSELYVHAWNKGAHPQGSFHDLKRFTTHKREKKQFKHPAVKPIDLMRKIVRVVNADLIIDPFMGTGTTGEACALEGKSFIGIEKDPEYFEMAVERLKRFM